MSDGDNRGAFTEVILTAHFYSITPFFTMSIVFAKYKYLSLNFFVRQHNFLPLFWVYYFYLYVILIREGGYTHLLTSCQNRVSPGASYKPGVTVLVKNILQNI